MEVYRGSLQESNFQNWLERLMKDQRNKIVIVADDISCYEARVILRRAASPGILHSYVLNNLKKALAHFITCERNQRCRQIIIQILRGQSEDS